MLAPLRPPTPFASDPSVRRPAGATAGFAFRLTRPDDGPRAIATAARSAPATCGWVASAVGTTTRRTT